MEKRIFIEDNAVIIGIGDYCVGTFPMATIGVGSCVALILHDRLRSTGALAHVMLPESCGVTDRPGKFADTAIEAMVAELEGTGSARSHIVAKIVGGACMFAYSTNTLNIGRKNVDAIRNLLKEHCIRIEAEETGGRIGRSVIYRPAESGRLTIKRADGTCIDL